MQWRKAPHRRDVSGYEFFVKTNLPWLRQSLVGILSPPRKGAFSKPPYPSYLVNRFAVWPNHTPYTLNVLAARSGNGVGLAPTFNAAFAIAREALWGDMHNDATVTSPLLQFASEHVPPNFRVVLRLLQLTISYELPTTPSFVPTSHYTAGSLTIDPESMPGGFTGGYPVTFNGTPLILPQPRRYYYPSRHPSLLAPWVITTPDPFIPGYMDAPPYPFGADVEIWDRDLNILAPSMGSRLTHWTPILDHNPPIFPIIWRDAAPFFPNHPPDTYEEIFLDQAVTIRYPDP